MGNRVALSSLKGFVEGKPYNEEVLFTTLHGICQAVAARFFRSSYNDEEFLEAARFKLVEILCEGKVDFSRSQSQCFAYLYTAARNFMTKQARGSRDVSCGLEPLGSLPCSRDAGIWKVDFEREAEIVRRRAQSVNLETRYDDIQWRAAAYRASEGF